MKTNEEKYQKLIFLISMVTVLLFVLCFIFLRKHEVAVASYKFDKSKVVNDGYQFWIDDVTANDGYAISGWLIKEGVDIGVIERTVVLKDKTSKKYIEIATEIVNRPDLETYLGDGVNYSDSGFYAVISASDMIKKHDYEVFIVDNSDGEKNIIKISNSIKEELTK
ncbi:MULTISPECIES: hypothetical protein [Streptococcus]|uniref:Uncharacterized protein n=1 Tax=Streptococcus caledonicus TaxID=2614158 RepID=A0ABW0UBK4_9STRE|nr:hypothetical protein [Streptococcus sp. S784/96/1]